MDKQKIVQHAWLFDVDGVITHPEKKQITEPQILDEILKRLRRGEPVALNTGRSLSWLIERVINPLLRKISDKSILINFLVVGEKGGTWLIFDKEGKTQKFIDKTIPISVKLQQGVKKLIKVKYGQTMFFDETKETMISVEMKDSLKIKNFQPQQNRLNKSLEKILEKYHLVKQFKIEPSIIATDLESKNVGKHFAVRIVIKWLHRRSIKPKQFFAFGDSLSDIEMAKELHHQGYSVEFVFVGELEEIAGRNFPYPVTITKARLEKGTLEYLQKPSNT